MVMVWCFSPRPPITPSTTATQPSARPRPKNKREICWRKQCVVGMAMAIVMVESGPPTITITITIIGDEHEYESTSWVKGRWSSKRGCRAWQLNSLEAIVPEDLPRPSFQRTWQWVDAPPVKATSSRRDSFSM